MIELPTLASPKLAKVHPREVVSGMDYGDLKGLRVLLINMPLRESAKPNTPPQGPGMLAARLEQYGAEPTIVDLNAYRRPAAGKLNGRWLTYEEATGKLERHIGKHGAPDIIGLSGMITTQRWQEFAAQTARRLVPESFIISGGGLATEIKEGLFGWTPELDAVVHSEGDDALLVLARDVLQARQTGGSMTHLPQHLGSLGGRERFMYAGDRPKNLDILPFAAWHLLDEDVDGERIMDWYLDVPVWGLAANNSSATSFTMNRSLTAVSSRGCPYECAFCYRGAQGERLYGMRSEENLVEEVLYWYRKYGIDFFGFNDDNFAVDKRRIARLPEAFKPIRELGIRWGTHTRLDEAADERAAQMAAAGCIYIGFGAESASPKVLERMKKGGFILRPRGAKEDQVTRVNGFDFPTTMVQGIINCEEENIEANLTWIMGFPGEGLRELQTSVGFIAWQKSRRRGKEETVNQKMFSLTAYPGTAVFRDPACRETLTTTSNISFQPNGEPVPNEALYRYVLELDDATKVMHGPDGRPIYFGDMTIDQFLEAREYADSGRLEKILDMN